MKFVMVSFGALVLVPLTPIAVQTLPLEWTHRMPIKECDYTQQKF